MATYIVVSKNQYPYHTVHVAGCSALRDRGQSVDVERIDGLRWDKCKRCLALESDAMRMLGESLREVRDARIASDRLHINTRRVAALRVALAAAESQPYDADNLAEYERMAAEGKYTLPEVTIGR